MRTAIVIILLAGIGTAGRAAEDETGCGKFAWSIERDRALAAASDKPTVQSGAAFPKLPDAAFVVTVQPGGAVAFVKPPERARHSPDASDGVVTIEQLPQAGLYQLTLSEDAWVDVIQGGEYMRSAGTSGRRDCPGVRKSLRFHLAQAPIVLQLSDVASSSVIVTLRLVSDK